MVIAAKSRSAFKKLKGGDVFAISAYDAKNNITQSHNLQTDVQPKFRQAA